MKMKMGEAAGKYGAPVGQYLCKFVGCEERESEQYGPGLEWSFEVLQGEHRGKIVTRTTGLEPSLKNACGRMVLGLSGGAVNVGADFDSDQYVGRTYMVMVEPNSTGNGTRVGSVMPTADAQRPAAPPPGPPPRRQPPPAPPVKRFYVEVGDDQPRLLTFPEVSKLIADEGLDPTTLAVCPEGADAWKTAAECGIDGKTPF